MISRVKVNDYIRKKYLFGLKKVYVRPHFRSIPLKGELSEVRLNEEKKEKSQLLGKKTN